MSPSSSSSSSSSSASGAWFAPFSPGECARLRAALDAPPPADVAGLARLRAAASGREASLAALDAHLAAHPADRAVLFGRVVPAWLASARALVAGAPPALALHREGQGATTRLPRALTPGWLAHLLLGTLAPAEGDLPVLATDLLLARTAPQEVAKVRAMLGVFARPGPAPLPGVLTITRRCPPARGLAAWRADPAPLAPLEIVTDGGIEDADGHLQVDFANRSLGGGVLTGGCVQEEIRFAVSPELMVAMLVSPRMGDGEAIAIHGAERFAATTGYAFGLAWAGDHVDASPRIADGTPDVEVVAMDALDFRRGDPAAQHGEAALLRELEKARAGFAVEAGGDARPVATGNWGCGVFGGEPTLKAVLQWIAASSAGRPLRYYPYGDRRVAGLAGFVAAARTRLPTAGALLGRLLAVAPGRPDDAFAAVLATA